MNRYKIALLNNILDNPRTEVLVWEDDEEESSSLRDIHFIQDKSGVDRLTFSVNADHPQYDNFTACMDKIVRLYCGSTYFDFIIMYVDADKIQKKKDITCVAPMIMMDWTPVMLRNGRTYSGWTTLPPQPVNSRPVSVMSQFISEVDEMWEENLTFSCGSLSQARAHTDDSEYRIPDELRYTKFYSDVKNNFLEVLGLAFYRINSHYVLNGRHFASDYNLDSFTWLNQNAPIIEVDSVEAILSWKETEDLDAYKTHATIYKQDDSTGRLTKFKTEAVRTTALQKKYGQRYIVSPVGDDSFTAVKEQTKNAVRSTFISSSNITLNPAAINDYHDVSIYKRIHIDVSELGMDKMFLITECDRCIDDALKTKIKIEEVSS